MSALAQAIGFILHGPTPNTSPNPNVRILDYGDENVFRDLWLKGLESNTPIINDAALDWNDSNQQILIIGNDPPDNVLAGLPESLRIINFRSHFTAASWLAAWKVKFTPKDENEKKQGKIEAKAQIAVIDPRATDVANGTARALQTILGARDASGRTLVPRTAVLDAPSLAGICQWLKDSASDRERQRDTGPHLRELLKTTIWNELTSASEQHHALSNVLGPVILSGKEIKDDCFNSVSDEAGQQPSEEQRRQNAENRTKLLLRRLLEACGLVSWKDATAKTQEKQDAESKEEPELGKDLSILLLDDQADQGWLAWVKECLPEAAGAMTLLLDPAKLVEAIIDALKPVKYAAGTITGFQNKDSRFRLHLPELGEAKNPVLLLDLRLFAGNADNERKFFKTLLPLVKHFTDKTNLAWPGFSSKDKKRDKPFRDAKAAVLRGKLEVDSPQHHEALTWLPRIVALADMSLPIILFSSTGRRDLVEPFKSYGNIITTFEKPRLHDLASTADAATDIRGKTSSSLRDAVTKARNWLPFRQCTQRARAEVSSQNENPVPPPDFTHFEIYFDESGSDRESGFRVAALLVGYKNADHADDVAKQMHNSGASWFGEKGCYIYDKDDSRVPSNLQRYSEVFCPLLACLWMVPMVLWSNPEHEVTSSDCFNADTLIQSLVSDLLEICLFNLLPVEESHTYVIYGAQRRIIVPDTEEKVTPDPDKYQKQSKATKSELDTIGILPSDTKKEALETYQKKYSLEDYSVEYAVVSIKKSTDVNIVAQYVSIKSSQDYGGMLARVFQSRPWKNPWKRMSGKIQRRLSRLNQSKDAELAKKDRPVNILADILPGDASWNQVNGAFLNVFSQFLPANCKDNPILLAQGAELTRLLAIGRAVDGDDFGLALASAASLSFEIENHAGLLYRAVRNKLGQRLEGVQGTHLTAAHHHLAIMPPGTTGNLPFSQTNIKHRHWTRYPTPDPAIQTQLEKYAGDKLVADFGISPSILGEEAAARWILDDAWAKAYQGITINEVLWMVNKVDDSLFAIVSVLMPPADWPSYRKISITVPKTLYLTEEGTRSILALSMGPVPLGRLWLDTPNNSIQWLETDKANLYSRWTGDQVKAVVTCDFKKLKPMKYQDVAAVSKKFGGHACPRFYQDQNNVVLFAAQDEIDAASTHKRPLSGGSCAPDDFDAHGAFKHNRSSWPATNAPAQADPQPAQTRQPASLAAVQQPPAPSQTQAAAPTPPPPPVPVEITGDEAWLGPVPLSNCDGFKSEAKKSLAGWEPKAGLVYQRVRLTGEWWIGLERKDRSATIFTGPIVLLDRELQITDQNPAC